MNKLIAYMIKKFVDESPYDFFTYKLIRFKKTPMWEVNLYFEDRDNAHSEALVNLLRNLGLVYGEALSIQDKGKLVEVR